MITVTESAKEQAIKLMKDENLINPFIRVGVKGGGCSGLSYDLFFDNVLNDGDQEFESNGVKIVCDKKSLLYIFGTELDYSGGLNGKGFTFNNPNASRSCGCGQSFSV
jgi:iron-sulfur cluster assembly protein